MTGNELVIERIINAPIERVWRALTSQEDLKQWLPFFSGFKPEVGTKLKFKLGKDPDHQYVHLCEVKEVEENSRLVYSWRYEGYPGYSNVIFELSPAGNSATTKLKLTHEITAPFPADNPDFSGEGFKEGWTYTADGLKEFVESN
ncbi:MAG TPA: SRPBCC domain-containing protein [Candidatus Saccharimonadales bacterium]|nr:SRPBCC domain-containing protein [Candidatus Saccharimonadales bacterium]